MRRLTALVPLLASSAFGQCVMCFRTAAAQNAERARVMNLGILIMLIPPILILAGFMLLCYKRSKAYADMEQIQPLPAEQDLAEAFAGNRT